MDCGNTNGFAMDNGFDDFDVGNQNAVDFHSLNAEYEAQVEANRLEEKERMDNQHVRYKDIVIDRKSGYKWQYQYDDKRLVRWKRFVEDRLKDNVNIYTSTMLTFSGIDGLVPCEEDEKRVKKVLTKDIEFK